LLTSPIERKKRAFKPGAPPITGAIPALDVPFVHLGGEPSFYGGSTFAHCVRVCGRYQYALMCWVCQAPRELQVSVLKTDTLQKPQCVQC
jgi:hypothetical protein